MQRNDVVNLGRDGQRALASAAPAQRLMREERSAAALPGAVVASLM